jgi:hypothetical protein
MISGRVTGSPPPFGIIGTVTSADGERERLTALGGLAVLSLDALSSVAYGPEAILVVLVAAGAPGCATACRSPSRSWCFWSPW